MLYIPYIPQTPSLSGDNNEAIMSYHGDILSHDTKDSIWYIIGYKNTKVCS